MSVITCNPNHKTNEKRFGCELNRALKTDEVNTGFWLRPYDSSLRPWKLRGFPERCLYLVPLLSAEGGELETIVGSKRTHDLGWDNLIASIGQRDLESHRLAWQQGISDESTQTTFTEIADPTLQA